MIPTLKFIWDFTDTRTQLDLSLGALRAVADKEFVIAARATGTETNLSWTFSGALNAPFIYNPSTTVPGHVQLKRLATTLGISHLELEITAWKDRSADPAEYFGECWAASPLTGPADARQSASILDIGKRVSTNG